eukprot:g3287.t1
MPALSPTMTEGVIAQWRTDVGKEVQAGDIYAEIETDKATVDFEATDDAFVAKIFVASGTNVTCGEPIALVVEEESDIAAFADFSLASIETDTSAPDDDVENSPSADTSAPSSPLPDHVLLAMPALSPTMEEGLVARWLKSEGDEIVAGDIIAEIDTDKATVDFDHQDDGFLARILSKEGSTLDVGTPIAVVVEDADDIAAFSSLDAASILAASAEGQASPAAAVAKPDVVETSSTTAAKITPAVPSPPAIERTVAPTANAPIPFEFDDADFLPFRSDVRKSPVGAELLRAQAAYEEEFGITGMRAYGSE